MYIAGNAVKTVINKWSKSGMMVTLLRTGRPPETDEERTGQEPTAVSC